MTGTVITDEIREIGRKALGVFWDDAPARQIGLAADTFLEVVAPMILEEALRAQPSTAENPNESAYERGRFDGVMAFAAAIRALKGGE
jgi:hypothetical protein